MSISPWIGELKCLDPMSIDVECVEGGDLPKLR